MSIMASELFSDTTYEYYINEIVTIYSKKKLELLILRTGVHNPYLILA
jgi:hypothetical protein